MSQPVLDLVRVFVSGPGRGGNPLGVFLDASAFAESDYQPVAADLGFSETVFVEDRQEARLRIFTPAVELPLAGHPLVGTSWLMHREGPAPDVLRPPAGEIATWESDGVTWIRADPAKAPHFDFVELHDPVEVETLDASPGGGTAVAWAWANRSRGMIRARAFLADYGVAEDEATGAAALRLCALLDRPVQIHQGVASRLDARPAADGTVELGGRTEAVERRPYERSG